MSRLWSLSGLCLVHQRPVPRTELETRELVAKTVEVGRVQTSKVRAIGSRWTVLLMTAGNEGEGLDGVVQQEDRPCLVGKSVHPRRSPEFQAGLGRAWLLWLAHGFEGLNSEIRWKRPCPTIERRVRYPVGEPQVCGARGTETPGLLRSRTALTRPAVGDMVTSGGRL